MAAHCCTSTPITGADLPEDPDVRTYLLASTDHFGSSKIKEALPTANPVHRLDVTPVNRALLVALEDWVCEGRSSPVRARCRGPAMAPRSPAKKSCRSSATPPLRIPRRFRTRAISISARTPIAGSVVGRSSWASPYVDLVSAVDEDGNEVAGIRLPAVAAPLAAYTGWNPRRHIDELPDVLYERVGSKLAVPAGTALGHRTLPVV